MALLATATVAGCQSAPAPAPRGMSGVNSEPATAEKAPEVPREPKIAAPVPRTKPPAPPTDAQLLALGATDNERPLTPGAVIGLGAEEVRRLLGEPVLRTDDPPAWIWQYQTAECTLRLTFFPEVKTQRYRTLSVALGNTEEDTEDAKSRCLNAVRADRLTS